MVESQAYSAKSVDLSSVILRLKGAGADVVLHTALPERHRPVLPPGRGNAGYKPKAMIGGGGGYSLIDTARPSAPPWKARTTSTSRRSR